MRKSGNTLTKLFGAVCVILLLIVGVIFTLPAIATVDNSTVENTSYESAYNWTTEITAGTFNIFPIFIILTGIGMVVLVIVFIYRGVT